MKRISNKRWIYFVVLSVSVILTMCIVLVITIDPYLHYRKPLRELKYSLTVGNAKYINDGIIRQFDYNAIITGTSMTENFKPSEFDEFFSVCSVKIPLSGATYKDINDNCKRALERNPNTEIVLRGLDLSVLVYDKDKGKYNDQLVYLYDDVLINDVGYCLNKMTILEGCFQNVILHSLVSDETFSLDTYTCWDFEAVYGKQNVLSGYERPEKVPCTVELSDEEKIIIKDNIRQNVTDLVKSYPETKFIMFFTPYSICWWDSLNQEEKIKWEVEAQRIAIEEMLSCPNVELYSFCNNFNMICNLDNYKDEGHYRGSINSSILHWIARKQYRLTESNYEEYLEEIYNFYSTYDYDAIFAL